MFFRSFGREGPSPLGPRYVHDLPQVFHGCKIFLQIGDMLCAPAIFPQGFTPAARYFKWCLFEVDGNRPIGTALQTVMECRLA